MSPRLYVRHVKRTTTSSERPMESSETGDLRALASKRKSKKGLKPTRKINILVVCTGNTCRSPMAQVIYTERVKALGKSSKIRVTSAGLAAEVGEKTNPRALAALDLLGYPKKAIKAKQYTRQLGKRADLVVCMTVEQRACVGMINAYTVGSIMGGKDVADPYGGTIKEYLFAARQIEASADAVISFAEELARLAFSSKIKKP